MKEILRREGQVEHTGLKKALHIVRGHFKDYTKGSGLFGKYQGIYWWDAHVAGDLKLGTLAKTYKVDVSQTPHQG
jgi:hypothetical protein